MKLLIVQRIRRLVVTPVGAALLGTTVLAMVLVTTGGFSPARLHRITVAVDHTDAQASVPPAVTLDPPQGSTEVPISAEIGGAVKNGVITGVALVDSAGSAIPGALRQDRSSWVPAGPLRYGQSYTATVTVTGPAGTITQATSFTTMAQPRSARTYASVYLHDGATYGVGMPVVVEFNVEVPAPARAAVQRRIFVHSEPAQPGGWHWYGGRVAMFRPQSYWMPGTKLKVRVALTGLPIGNRFGESEESATATIGRHLRMEVDNPTKRMSVISEGAVIKTIPVSLGKPSTPTSSGTMVVMAKHESTVFDTRQTDGPDGYRVEVSYAQRLTWGGEFIHAAPWSEGDQGYRNVSHGCINVSMANAAWLFKNTLIGDPVTIRGTERALVPGNGWTAWDTPWSEFSAAATTM